MAISDQIGSFVRSIRSHGQRSIQDQLAACGLARDEVVRLLRDGACDAAAVRLDERGALLTSERRQRARDHECLAAERIVERRCLLRLHTHALRGHIGDLPPVLLVGKELHDGARADVSHVANREQRRLIRRHERLY